MHRNDLRFYRREQLLELSLILGTPVPPESQHDVERIKDVIVAGYNNLPPFMRAHRAQLDKFLGSYK